MNLLFFWNSPVNFTIHFRYVQCWYFSGVFCDSESSGNFVMEVHEYVNVYESFYISADISAHTDYIWSPWLSTYADKLSIYMGTSQQWWGPIYWLEPSSKLFLKLQHSLHSQLWLSRRHWEMCAFDLRLCICYEWIYAPRAIVLVQQSFEYNWTNSPI